MTLEPGIDERQAVIYVVDDDDDVRSSLRFVLKNAGLNCIDFADPNDFLNEYDISKPGCCLFDMQMSSMSGIELARYIKARGTTHPIIFLTGHGTIQNAIEAIRFGAIDYLEKPSDHTRLLQCIRKAIHEDFSNRFQSAQLGEFERKVESLSAREKEVMEMVAQGLLTKQIAARLNIKQKTVDVHRSNVNRKMEVQSVAQLVRLLSEHGWKGKQS